MAYGGKKSRTDQVVPYIHGRNITVQTIYLYVKFYQEDVKERVCRLSSFSSVFHYLRTSM